jgi:hypothetical protein
MGKKRIKTEQGHLSEDDESGRVMGTISKPELRRQHISQPKQMMHDELAPPGLLLTTISELLECLDMVA